MDGDAVVRFDASSYRRCCDGYRRRWLQHPSLTSADAGSPLPGVNGLTIHASYVVMTSSDRGLILRVPAASRHPADNIEVVADRLVGDDLAPL